MDQFNSIESPNCRGALYECLGMVCDMMEEGELILNPEQLAYCSYDITSDRFRKFVRKYDGQHDYQGEYFDNVPKWINHVGTPDTDSWLCEKYGHIGDSYGDAESGAFDFFCIFCDFYMDGYM